LKYIYNAEDDHKYWEWFRRYGTKLYLEDEIDYDEYSPHRSTPV
jgi:hypothetical protein